MEAVHYVNTADKAKMLLVGSHWDMDNAGYVSPYILKQTETLIYHSTRKRASLKVDNPPTGYDNEVQV